MTAVKHPLRRRILHAYLDGEVACASAGQLGRELGQEVGKIAYHLKTLTRCDILSPVGGGEGAAPQHLYGLAPDIEAAWLRLVLEVWSGPDVRG